MKIFAGITIVACIALIGCSNGQDQTVEIQEPAGAQWSAVTPGDMSETQTAQHQLCKHRLPRRGPLSILRQT